MLLNKPEFIFRLTFILTWGKLKCVTLYLYSLNDHTLFIALRLGLCGPLESLNPSAVILIETMLR